MKKGLHFQEVFVRIFLFDVWSPYNIWIRRCGSMAKCEICEKGAHFGIKVSHSHRRSNKMWKSNIKTVRVKTDGGSKKMHICTSCLRSGRVERA